VRVRWWDTSQALRQAAILSEAERKSLPDLEIPGHARLIAHSTNRYFWHYWMTGTPNVLSDKVACVDYSAGKVIHSLPIVGMANLR